MPIKWSALQVNDAMDMVDDYVHQAIPYLEQAKIVAAEAKKIADLPQYVEQRLVRLSGEIERLTGGVLSWNGATYEGSIRASITAVRDAIPDGAIEEERARLKCGRQQALIA